MIGKRVEMLVVIAKIPGGKLVCKCDCGNEKVIRTGHFNTGSMKSCGCHVERHGKASANARSREYVSWGNMVARCHNPKNKRYKDYGDRGIIVCQEWRDSFATFYADMGDCPEGFQIDRENNNGIYEPGNCRWVSAKNNMANRGVSKIYVINGDKFASLLDASKRLNVSQATIRAWCEGRLVKHLTHKSRMKKDSYYPPKLGCFVENIY
jgi:hypothetical protein